MFCKCYDHLSTLNNIDNALSAKDTETMKAIMPSVEPEQLGYKPNQQAIQDSAENVVSENRPADFVWLSDEEPMQGDADFVPAPTLARNEPEQVFSYRHSAEAIDPQDAPTWDELMKP